MPSPKAGAQDATEIPMPPEVEAGYQAEIDHANAQRYGHFPELTIEANRVIWDAREKGWDVFYACYPSAMSQAENTHRGAVEFLKGAK